MKLKNCSKEAFVEKKKFLKTWKRIRSHFWNLFASRVLGGVFAKVFHGANKRCRNTNANQTARKFVPNWGISFEIHNIRLDCHVIWIFSRSSAHSTHFKILNASMCLSYFSAFLITMLAVILLSTAYDIHCTLNEREYKFSNLLWKLRDEGYLMTFR